MGAPMSEDEEVPAVGEGESGELFARVEAQGASAGEAKWAAMKELELAHPGLAVEYVAFEVLEEVASGGENGGFARVAAVADLGAWRAAEERFEWPDEATERARELVRRITAYLGLRASVEVVEEEDVLKVSVSGPELGLFIGKHGQTIDAIQFLCTQAVYRGREERKRVVVDAGGYRERREAAVLRQADRGAADAARYGRAVELDSMPAFERKLVHSYLDGRVDVETHSEGDEPFRRIVITPVRQRPDSSG
jgi:spoIIIJ-associated protein